MALKISRHVVQIFCACLWCLLASGIIFGFAALKPVLIQEGVYSELCQTEYTGVNDEPCVEQDMKLNSMFTISSALTNMMALIVGWILDHKGPRVCGIIGAIILSIGSLMFVKASELITYVDAYLIGYIALAIGGPFVFISCFQLANCFPKRSGTILALLTGSFDSSSALFLVYRILYKKSGNTFSLSRFFTLYLSVPIFILACQLTIMPQDSYKTIGTVVKLGVEELDENGNEIEENMEDNRQTPQTDITQVDEEQPLLRRRKSALEIATETRLKENTGGIFGILHDNTATEQIKSPWFYLMLAFAAIIMVRINYFIATIRSQEEYLLGNKEESILLNHIFDTLLPIGGICAVPFIGMILDHIKTIAVINILCTTSVAVGLFGILPKSFWGNFVGIVIFVLYRPFYYTVVSDYCSKVFGFTTFGTVYGLLTCLCGVFSLTQNLLDEWTHGYFDMNPIPVNILVTLLTLIAGVSLEKYVKFQLKLRENHLVDSAELVTDENNA